MLRRATHLRMRRAVAARLAVLGLFACTEDVPSVDFCPDGSTAVVGGCLPIPDRTGVLGDASVAPDLPSPDTSTDSRDVGTADSGAGVDLTGQWALEVNTRLEVTEPGIDPEVVQRTTIMLADIQPSDGGLATALTLCGVVLGAFGGLQVTYPAAAVASARTWAPGALRVEGNEVSIGDFGFLLGWDSDQPRLDEIPTDPDDPRVEDRDGDGNPGVSLALEGVRQGQAFVVSRTSISVGGRSTAPSAVAGTSRLTETLRVLDAAPPDTLDGPTLVQTGAENANTFRMLRIDGDCAAALDAL